MPTPIVWGLVALALLLSCDNQEKAPPPKKTPPPPPDPKPPEAFTCPSPLHVSRYGVEKVEICLEDRNLDGQFQKEEEGLRFGYRKEEFSYQNLGEEKWKLLQGRFAFPEFNRLHLAKWKESREFVFPKGELRWDTDTERLLTNSVDFCRERGLDLAQALKLASKFRPAGTNSSLSPKEKAYALMIASLLLDVKKQDKPFYRTYRGFIDAVLKNLEAGKLKLADLNKGQEESLHMRAAYETKTNTLVIKESSLDLGKPLDCSTLLHELFHFYQDIQKQNWTLVQGEVEAHLMEGDYLLHEEGLHGKSASPEKMEAYIAKKILPPNPTPFEPVTPTLRTAFFRARNDKKQYEAWLKKSRAAFENGPVFQDISVMMTRQLDSGKADGLIQEIWKKSGANPDSGPEVLMPLLDGEIVKFQSEKVSALNRLKKLLNQSKLNYQDLQPHYQAYIEKSSEILLLESLKENWKQLRKRGKTLTETEITNFVSKRMVPKAEELGALKIHQTVHYPMDGAD